MNWIKIGMEMAPHLATLILTVIIVIYAFRKFVAPEFQAKLEMMEKAEKTIKTLASLGAIKKSDYTTERALGKEIAADVLKQTFPEAEGLKLILSPATWEKVEDAMEDNPEAILQLIEKYGPVLGIGAVGKQEEHDF